MVEDDVVDGEEPRKLDPFILKSGRIDDVSPAVTSLDGREALADLDKLIIKKHNVHRFNIFNIQRYDMSYGIRVTGKKH